MSAEVINHPTFTARSARQLIAAGLSFGGIAVRTNRVLRLGEYIAFGATMNECRAGRFGEHPLPAWTQRVEVSPETLQAILRRLAADDALEVS